MNDYLQKERKDKCVLELSKRLDRAIDEFAEENEALIREACVVPDSVDRVRTPAVLAMLGHCLWRVYDTKGRQEALDLATRLLDDFSRLPSRAGGLSAGERLDG